MKQGELLILYIVCDLLALCVLRIKHCGNMFMLGEALKQMSLPAPESLHPILAPLWHGRRPCLLSLSAAELLLTCE